MFMHQFSRAVGEQLVLLDDNITHRPHTAEITELHQGEIRAEHQDVVQLHVQVTQLLGMDKLQS